MSAFRFGSILEVLYSVGDMDKVMKFFVDFGGWNKVGSYIVDRAIMEGWGLPSSATATEVLLQSHNHPSGQLRMVKFTGVEQKYIRSSQQPWDVGGIMDINLRVHDVASVLEELRERGWHSLSDPLLQVMGPFKLYDILMKGYDETIVAFTHRIEPPLAIEAPIKLPSHIYNSSITVNNLREARSFYVDILGCQVLNEYEVKKEYPQENMFGLPFNMVDKVTCKAVMLSFDGDRDVVFQIVEFDGVEGKNFSERSRPPNRGFFSYRVLVSGISAYYTRVKERGAVLYAELNRLSISPYGKVKCFSILSPNGVIWEFIESIE